MIIFKALLITLKLQIRRILYHIHHLQSLKYRILRFKQNKMKVFNVAKIDLVVNTVKKFYIKDFLPHSSVGLS